MPLIVLFLLLVLWVIALGLLNSFLNSLFLKRLEEYPQAKEHPFVSILVPARNEEKNIEKCVGSLLQQDYGNFEVLVLDDNSTDKTFGILTRLAKSDLRLHILNGKPLPEGWPGKHWACQQLAQEAHGEWLLFTDADTVHAPQALRLAVAAMEDEQADLLTAFPREEVVTWGEKFIVPFMNFAILSFLPLWLTKRKRIPSLSVTIGQFMFFRRSTYEAIGGYAAARENVNDDVLLGRLTLERGYKWVLVDGTRQINCRMYHNLNETMEGFGKNVFGFFNYRILPYFFAWLAVAYFFLKPIMILAQRLLGAELPESVSKLALAAVLGSMLLFFMAYKQLRIPLFLVPFYPVTIFMFVLVAYRSLFLTLTGHTSWKGRELKCNEVHWI